MEGVTLKTLPMASGHTLRRTSGGIPCRQQKSQQMVGAGRDQGQTCRHIVWTRFERLASVHFGRILLRHTCVAYRT